MNKDEQIKDLKKRLDALTTIAAEKIADLEEVVENLNLNILAILMASGGEIKISLAEVQAVVNERGGGRVVCDPDKDGVRVFRVEFRDH